MADPRNLKPGELLRTLNSTPLGQVLSELKLRGHRARAGARFERADGKRIDLLRYAAWLASTRHAVASTPQPPTTLRRLAAEMAVSTRTLHTWIARGCPRGPLEAVRAWHADNVLPRQGGPRKERDPEAGQLQQALQQRVNEAKAREAEEAARYKQIKSDLLERRLVPIDQVVREAAELFTDIRAILESIPDAVAKEMPQPLQTRAFDVARNKVAAALKKLADIHLVGSDDDGA